MILILAFNRGGLEGLGEVMKGLDGSRMDLNTKIKYKSVQNCKKLKVLIWTLEVSSPPPPLVEPMFLVRIVMKHLDEFFKAKIFFLWLRISFAEKN